MFVKHKIYKISDLYIDVIYRLVVVSSYQNL